MGIMAPRTLTSRRRIPRPGLTMVEVNHGRVEKTTFDRTVEDAKARIHRDYPRVEVLWDHEAKEHLITQHGLDGTHSLVFSTPHFHEDLIRLELDRRNLENGRDPLEEVDRHNDHLDAEFDRRISERVHEAGEKLAWAFAADGLTVRPKMTPLSVQMRKKKILSNFEVPDAVVKRRARIGR